MANEGHWLKAYIPLAVTYRNDVLESVHHAAVVGLNRDGSVAFSYGDVGMGVFPRSSMKPLQAFGMLHSGLDLPEDLLALVCASHDGSQMHLDGVRKILQSVGLDETYLANTVDLPLDEGQAHSALRSGKGATSLQQNCSGKHAGMLATCVTAGWAHDASYLKSEHHLQNAMTRAIPKLLGEPVLGIGVDGCGAPAHVVSLFGLAMAFRALATGSAGDVGLQIHRAMTNNPLMVGGPERDVTLLMQGIPQLMAKDGAEGIFAAALPDGRAIALKVADGANRARPPLMRAALQALDVDISGVRSEAFESLVLGHGERVGEVRIVGELARFSSRR